MCIAGIDCRNHGLSNVTLTRIAPHSSKPHAVVTITTMNSKDIIKQLEDDGWQLRSVRGSHHVFKHPTKLGHITVPHPKRDLGVGLVHKLLKQAGLK